MSYDMSDAAIERRMESTCRLCGTSPGLECVGLISGDPLIETLGFPVHPERGDD